MKERKWWKNGRRLRSGSVGSLAARSRAKVSPLLNSSFLYSFKLRVSVLLSHCMYVGPLVVYTAAFDKVFNLVSAAQYKYSIIAFACAALSVRCSTV